MTPTTHWPAAMLETIAAADDLHIAPRRPNGQIGTPTWIWSVAVDDELYVRPYRGRDSSWYQSAIQTGNGIVRSSGVTHEVRFTPVHDEQLLDSVDQAYARKYHGSPYLPRMVAPEPRATTVAVTPAP